MDRTFLKHAATYGLATVLVQGGGFLLLPIYMRCLSPADYGVLELTGGMAETLGTLLLLGGFRQALFTFYRQAGDGAEQRRVVASAYALIGAAALAGGLVAFTLAPWLAVDFPPWALQLAALAVLVDPFGQLSLTLIQARVESGTYVVVVVAQFLLRFGLCILLVRVFRWGAVGALAATAATAFAGSLVLSARELARGFALPSASHLRAMVAFALPLLPGGACFFLLHQGDRFFLRGFATVAEIGTYALGYKLAMVARMFSLVPLYMVWSARMYDAAEQPDAAGVFGRVLTRVVAAYLFAGLGLCLFAPEVVAFLGGEGYAAAAAFVPPVALACGFQAAATLMDAAFFIRRRTGAKLGVTVAATVVMLGLYALLIPPYGAAGAALATLGGFAALAAFTYFATQRIFYVRYEWTRLVALFAVAAALASGHGLPLAAKVALLVAFPLAAWLGGLVSADEKRYARQVWNTAIRVRLWARRNPEWTA